MDKSEWLIRTKQWYGLTKACAVVGIAVDILDFYEEIYPRFSLAVSGLPKSAIYILLCDLSTSIPAGLVNVPGPNSRLPHAVMNVPLLSTFVSY